MYKTAVATLPGMEESGSPNLVKFLSWYSKRVSWANKYIWITEVQTTCQWFINLLLAHVGSDAVKGLKVFPNSDDAGNDHDHPTYQTGTVLQPVPVKVLHAMQRYAHAYDHAGQAYYTIQYGAHA